MVRGRLKISQVDHHVYFQYTPCLTDFTFEFIRCPLPPILSPSSRTFVELALVSYTSWRFYAFFGTNLLTRCHSASSLFSAVFVFQKFTQEILSKLDETKPEPPIFPDTRRSPKESQREARGPPHHLVARVTPRARHPMVCGP
jgi:hypothetical protein